MKVKRKEQKFAPVVITLTSMREVSIMAQALYKWNPQVGDGTLGPKANQMADAINEMVKDD